ncbi:hypothetical protein ATL39_1174 [Sinobaca qinghaiensis]|uniref:Amine oxidase domain-containing protein n=1 Tax=Sinobaca qinghaiensis TaxID=342944 RepID=A0A419V662_9BACL|nr:FAD-dependent oxidoreductase [Sinobaca qinghaiensis]RKD75475.1 hypothetical protein ATL39_1174 [Sinobaca qinghaiensis]
MKKKRVIIVGSGLAAWSAHTYLEAKGIKTTILEKSRGVGGRMATRRIGEGRADHGAQFFTARSEEMKQLVQEWQKNGWVKEWNKGFAGAEDAADGIITEEGGDGHPRYTGMEGMSPLVKRLWKGKDIHTSHLVQSIKPGKEGWIVEGEAGEDHFFFSAEGVLVTSPMPQTLALFPEFPGSSEDKKALEGLTYEKSIGLMIAYSGKAGIPEAGGIQWKKGDIAFAGCNYQKGISKKKILTIHASGEWSDTNWEEADNVLKDALLQKIDWLLTDAEIQEVQVKKWRYAKPDVLFPERSISWKEPAPAAFAGDIFKEGKVEGSVLSGRHAAEQLFQ